MDKTVVWTRLDETRATAKPARPPETTYFLDARGRELARKPGIYLVVDGRLHRAASETRRGPKLFCAPGNPNQVYPQRILERASIKPVSGGAAIVIAGFAEVSAEDGLPDQETHEILASLGPYVFVRTFNEAGCGAHPSYGASFRSLQIRHGGAIEVSLDELVEGAAELKVKAKQQFDRDAQADTTHTTLDGPPELSSIEPTLALPSFGPGPGGLGWSVQLTAPASWAGSYGGWGGYSRSAMVPAKLPKRFQSFATLAALSAKVLAAHPDERVLGASSGDFALPR